MFLHLALSACTSDTPVSSTAPRPGAISGRVLFDDGAPAAGAEVATTGAIAITDEEGAFTLPDLPPDAQTSLRVHPAGGTSSSKFVAVDEGETTHTTIRVMALRHAQLADAAAGGTIVTESGLELVFPPDGLANEAGDDLSGAVDIDYALLNTFESMAYAPGNLLALRDDGDTWQMVSNGMVEVTLTQAGRPVDVSRSVVISFPTLEIPDPEVGGACGTPFRLYGFDPETGLWGESELGWFEANRFYASVEQFSWWNCDATIRYQGCANAVLTLHGEAVSNLEVGVWLSDQTRQVVTSDSTGAVQIQVPTGRSVSVLAVIDGQFASAADDVDVYWSFGKATAEIGTCVELGTLEANGTDADGDGEPTFPFGVDCNDDAPGRTDANPCDTTPGTDSDHDDPDPLCGTGG